MLVCNLPPGTVALVLQYYFKSLLPGQDFEVKVEVYERNAVATFNPAIGKC